MWFGAAVIVLVPIVTVVLSLTLSYPVIRWASILVAVVALVFNLFGLTCDG